MAKKLKTFTFERSRGTNSSYDEYLEIPEDTPTEEVRHPNTDQTVQIIQKGQIWKLSPEDSPSGTAEIRSMQSTIANMARSRGLKLRSQVVVEEDGPYIIIQPYRIVEEA
jgi:hypothetical protein